jgi:uncharacterized protein YjlB
VTGPETGRPEDALDEFFAGKDTLVSFAQFAAEIRSAHQAIGRAHTLLDVLRRQEVEFMDGSEGADISWHLGDAARALRASLALARQATSSDSPG